jgi:hypothetical protein
MKQWPGCPLFGCRLDEVKDRLSITSIRFAGLRPFEQLFMLAGVADP